MPDVYVADKKKSVSEKKPVTSSEPKRCAKDYSEVMRKSSVNRNPFSAFATFPQGFAVDIQDPQEELLLLVRKHPITNFKWVSVVVLMLIAPVFLASFPGFSLLPTRFQLMTGVLWYLVTVAIALEGFLNWYFDVFLVTDERIIDIDFINLIYKKISTAKIDDIQDVNLSAGGVLASLLEYGTVRIQTASEVPEFSIEHTPNPDELVKLVNELILEEEKEKLEGRVR